MNWLAKTNQMWTNNDFAALDQITTGQMRTIYQSEANGRRRCPRTRHGSRSS